MCNKIYFLFVLYFCQSVNGFSFVDSLKTRTFLLGTETAGYIGSVKDWDLDEKYRYTHFFFGPQLGVFFNNNLVVGFSGEYSTYSSDLGVPPKGERAAGLFFRFYFDQSKIIPFFKWRRLSCYTGLTYHRGNYYTVKGGTKVDFSGLDVNTLSWNTGFNIKLWKGFQSELSLRPVYYIGYRFQVAWRLGVEYHFTKIKEK